MNHNLLEVGVRAAWTGPPNICLRLENGFVALPTRGQECPRHTNIATHGHMPQQKTSGPSPFFAAKGPLTTPVFQEELVRSESDQRASSITDSM